MKPFFSQQHIDVLRARMLQLVKDVKVDNYRENEQRVKETVNDYIQKGRAGSGLATTNREENDLSAANKATKRVTKTLQ